jgi:hypothetical protein
MAKLTVSVAIVMTFGVLAAGCGGGSGEPTPTPGASPTVTGQPETPTPGFPTPRDVPPIRATAPPSTPVPVGAAVYLSLGDSLQYGCCSPQIPEFSAHPAFAAFLSESLGRPVEWVTLAGNDTADEFVNGMGPGEAPQLERAVDLFQAYALEGRDVVAITLSIGGNDLIELQDLCEGRGGSDSRCVNGFSEMMEQYRVQLFEIYGALNDVKQPLTPVMQLNVYDIDHCGQELADLTNSAVATQVINSAIDGISRVSGAFLVDGAAAFKGHACEYIREYDPTYEGYSVLAQLYAGVWESLPPQFREEWVGE